MVDAEVIHLNRQELDWMSDRWEWSKWNIRRQISHIDAASFSWLLLRWKDELFPNGYDEIRHLADYSPSPNSPEGRWLDERKYVDLKSLLKMLNQTMKLTQHVLLNETVYSMGQKNSRNQAHGFIGINLKKHIQMEPVGTQANRILAL